MDILAEVRPPLPNTSFLLKMFCFIPLSLFWDSVLVFLNNSLLIWIKFFDDFDRDLLLEWEIDIYLDLKATKLIYFGSFTNKSVSLSLFTPRLRVFLKFSTYNFIFRTSIRFIIYFCSTSWNLVSDNGIYFWFLILLFEGH